MTIYNVMGWGKGKTTSAIGISARALINGEIVLFCQFLKDGKDCGIEALKELGKDFIHLKQGTQGFEKDNCTAFYNECLHVIEMYQPNLVVFDELNVALDYKLFNIPVESVIEKVKSIAQDRDVYITGRINNHILRHKMIELADIATNCYSEAHCYNRTCKKCGMDFNPHFEYCPVCGIKLPKSKKAKKGREC